MFQVKVTIICQKELVHAHEKRMSPNKSGISEDMNTSNLLKGVIYNGLTYKEQDLIYDLWS